MIPKEVLRQIRRIEIKTGKLVNDVFAGQYESVFKGRGMEFSEVREYLPGDDIRSIDWNVTARFGHPYVKKFVEERELTIMLLVDMSASGKFGTKDRFKSEISAEIAAVLSFSALKNNDKVGLIVFTDKIEIFVPPKKTRAHILRIIREILYFKPEHKDTDLTCGLEYLNEVIKRKSVVFLISDFLDKGYEKALKITNKRHDLVALVIDDPRERELPDMGLLELEDNETGENIIVDTSDKKFREEYWRQIEERIRQREKLFKTIRLDNIKITTGQSYVKPLVSFFELRARRFR
ncbi:MAG: hypothetical protein AUJ85_06840 [Elusimicrobia bacterium CG1_02_37_114]|nr:MAG: hypothetical protein AUJ85_06840 [Elusimicrobia bacterium CG1_02_37_114]PIV52509.1 MAG: DUF58 domain-containing protein [Elusimicrobia bacterium CG02_land_8_20_14_3_00_37_13]PIZ14286.1 MAG: DUF58 domain-containing protein [Elusimicrobia bacterium CG_4_10_14_0_8_um_filter_37_32]